MAAKNINMQASYESMDKLPSSTLKRHPKMDLNKNDLLRLLSYLEGELQARDISIATLKAEKAKQLLYQAKYGRFGLGDPFNALQRDSDSQQDNSFNETAVKAMYDNQLMQLENLIATQRKAQQRMREQLAAVEKRYHKVCAELEEEKQKHAQDTAQGDDVTYMLEKDRERLKQELDFEKNQVKKLEKESKKLSTSLEEEGEMSNKHKEVALMLIKERKHYMTKMALLQHRSSFMATVLKDDKSKLKSMIEGLAQESQKGLMMEAAIEKQLSEFDVEKEQLRGRLAREEARSADLAAQLEVYKQQLEHAGVSPSTTTRGSGPPVSSLPSNKIARNTPPGTPSELRRLPVVHIHSTPDREPTRHQMGDTPSKHDINNGNVAVKATEQTIHHHIPVDKPMPAEKPAELNSAKVNVISGGAVYSSSLTSPAASLSAPAASGGTTVFTTPSGTRISLNVGPVSQTGYRKPVPAGRGAPPPLPPNKPQVCLSSPVISSGSLGVASTGVARRDHMSVGVVSQASPLPEMPSQNLDCFGTEMEDLQKLLVSMATGASEGAASPLDPTSSTSVSSHSSMSSSFTSSNTSSSPSPSSQPNAHTTTLTTKLQQTVKSGNVSNLSSLLAELSGPNLMLLTQPNAEGSTLLHMAAELGHEDILSQLLTHGMDQEICNQEQATSLHVAASEGNLRCLEVLLVCGSNIHATDQYGWTPLHCAAANGHIDCCRLLLEKNASINSVDNNNWTPFHLAVHRGHANCLQQLITFKSANQMLGNTDDSQSGNSVLADVLDIVDKNGHTITHLAAMRESKECLEVLITHSKQRLTDRWTKSIQDVSSLSCKQYLSNLGSQTEKTCKIYVNVPEANANKCVDSECHIGNLLVTRDETWDGLEEQLSQILLNHMSEIEAGVKPRRMKHDQGTTAGSPDGSFPFSLGLTLNSIKYYSIGVYHWSPGTPTDRTPWDLLCSMNTVVIALQLFGIDDNCMDSLAYETLIPAAVLQNYVRLIEQYKNVIFYGPQGSGKTYMTRKLAQIIQLKDRHKGMAECHTVVLNNSFTQEDVNNMLVEKGCLIPSIEPLTPSTPVSILILDDLHTVSVATLFKEVFPVIENRGPGTTIRLRTRQGERDYYMHPGCYILGTMDRTRWSGLELSIQQRFRWVQFRCDQEPMQCILHRHLQRRLVNSHGGVLPPIEDKVHRAVEWVICVWQRLNEGLNKLGLLDLYYGPIVFLACPVEPNKPKAILRWLSLLWNHQLAPAVTAAVLRGSGSDNAVAGTGGQQKVASTALYVLMQRAVVSGCPLSGQEKERYLSSFQGSNELDIKMRKDSGSGAASPQLMTSPQLVRKLVSDPPAVAPSNMPPLTFQQPFHRTQRNPITKAASLDGSLQDSDYPELPSQASYHTSPDLSPNSNNIGSMYFALAGFPVAEASPKPKQTPPSSPSKSPHKFGIPVIVTQPNSPAGPFGSSLGTSISKSLESSLSDISDSGIHKLQTKVFHRALSPQPARSKAWSPGPVPRRAMSPEPDLIHRSDQGYLNYGDSTKTKVMSTEASKDRGPSYAKLSQPPFKS